MHLPTAEAKGRAFYALNLMNVVVMDVKRTVNFLSSYLPADHFNVDAAGGAQLREMFFDLSIKNSELQFVGGSTPASICAI
jgi:hypothetical protein